MSGRGDPTGTQLEPGGAQLGTKASPSVVNCRTIRDETAHYLSCPILSGIITQATGLNRLLTLHEQIFGNGNDDITGALACATSYHVYHSLKLGNLQII